MKSLEFLEKLNLFKDSLNSKDFYIVYKVKGGVFVKFKVEFGKSTTFLTALHSLKKQ